MKKKIHLDAYLKYKLIVEYVTFKVFTLKLENSCYRALLPQQGTGFACRAALGNVKLFFFLFSS